jgi:O-antigen/teichoic acid export membrane protein
MRKLDLYVGLLTMLFVTSAYAYIGPGAGAGTIAVVLGVLASICLAFIAIIWYPIKRLFKRRRKSSGESEPDSE